MPPSTSPRRPPSVYSTHSWWSDSNHVGATFSLHALAKPLMRYMYHRQVEELLQTIQAAGALRAGDMYTLASYLCYPYVRVHTKTLILGHLSNFVANEAEACRIVIEGLLDNDILVDLLDSSDALVTRRACFLLAAIFARGDCDDYIPTTGYWAIFAGRPRTPHPRYPGYLDDFFLYYFDAVAALHSIVGAGAREAHTVPGISPVKELLKCMSQPFVWPWIFEVLVYGTIPNAITLLESAIRRTFQAELELQTQGDGTPTSLVVWAATALQYNTNTAQFAYDMLTSILTSVASDRWMCYVRTFFVFGALAHRKDVSPCLDIKFELTRDKIREALLSAVPNGLIFRMIKADWDLTYTRWILMTLSVSELNSRLCMHPEIHPHIHRNLSRIASASLIFPTPQKVPPQYLADRSWARELLLNFKSSLSDQDFERAFGKIPIPAAVDGMEQSSWLKI